MPIFRGQRQNRRSGASQFQQSQPTGATQGVTEHGFYPQQMHWGSAKSGETLDEVSHNYANNNSRKVGDWSVGAVESEGRFYPTAMTASHADDWSAVNKDMQVGNIGFKSPRKARKAAVKGIKQSGGLPNSQSENPRPASSGILKDSSRPKNPFE